MNDFFSTIYNWCSSFYSQDWDEFLYEGEHYTILGWLPIIVCILAAAWFYFAAGSSFSGRKKWAILLLAVCVVNFLINLGWADYLYNDAPADEIKDASFSDEIGTSIISMLYGVVYFFIISCLMMPFSTNNENCPIKM